MRCTADRHALPAVYFAPQTVKKFNDIKDVVAHYSSAAPGPRML
jgi:hypothetical protein